jgi:hypothetical protein
MDPKVQRFYDLCHKRRQVSLLVASVLFWLLAAESCRGVHTQVPFLARFSMTSPLHRASRLNTSSWKMTVMTRS